MIENKYLNRGFLYSILIYVAASHGLAYLGVTDNWNLYTALLVSESLLLLPLLMVFLARKANPFSGIRWKLPPLGAWPLILLVTVCCYPLMSLCNMVTMLFTTNTASEISLQAVEGTFALNFLFMAVLPAVVEEFMFRGMFFHGYRRTGVWKGVFLSALLFGLMHMNVNQFCYALVLGVVMALVVEATGSIWSSVFMHLLVNGFSVVVVWLEGKLLGREALKESLESAAGSTMTEQYSPAELLPMIIVIAAAAVIGLIIASAFYYLLAVVCKRDRYVKALFAGKTEPMEKGKIFTVPLVIGILLAIGYMILFL